MPRFEGLAQFEVDVPDIHLAELRETEFKMRREPFGLDGKSAAAKVLEHVLEVAPDEVRQHPGRDEGGRGRLPCRGRRPADNSGRGDVSGEGAGTGARSGRAAQLPVQFLEGNFEFEKRVVAGFVHARALAGGPEKKAAEEE